MDSQRSNARRPLVVGNWKMHGTLLVNEQLLADLRALLDAPMLAGVDVAVPPPAPYPGQAGAWLRDAGVAWGAQDVAEQADGAFTGEVSATMLRDLGCRWVTVGHSERRTLFGERDERVAAKAARALGAGLGVIVCVGETLDERQAGLTESVLARQVSALAGLAGQPPQHGAELVLAYEPVWAIGTGVSASPQQAQAAHAWIRARLADAGLPAATTRVLYGGSVKADNAGALFAMPDIDGGLVGGAALDAQAFAAICRHALTV